jgi:hypothetical protein
MKKVILLMALGLSLFALPACDNNKSSKEDKELSTSDVPTSVKDAFNSKYSGAMEVKWEDAQENNEKTYKAEFSLNGKRMEAEFDANGTFIKENEDS